MPETASSRNGKKSLCGVEDSLSFHEHEYDNWAEGQIIVIGTDGIWETENAQGERFGKDRLRDIIRWHHTAAAPAMVEHIIEALAEFRGTVPQLDDITLVVIKTNSLQGAGTVDCEVPICFR